MRKVPYRCDTAAYDRYYCNQIGNGLSVFSGAPVQRGAGLGNILGGIGRAIIPLLKSGGKALLRQGLNTGFSVARDVLTGKNIKRSVKRRAKEAAGNLLDNASTSLLTPIKRNTKRPKAQKRGIKKRRRNNDIFGA